MILAIAIVLFGKVLFQGSSAPQTSKQFQEQLGRQQDPKLRIKLLEQFIKANAQSTSSDRLSDLETLLGLEYCKLKKPLLAKSHFDEAIRWFSGRSAQDRYDLSKNLGDHLFDAGDDQDGILYFAQARQIAESNHLTQDLIENDLFTGDRVKDQDFKEDCYFSALAEAKVAGLNEYVGDALADLGFMAHEAGDYLRSRYYIEKSLPFQNESDDPTVYRDELRKLVVCSGFLGDVARAEKYGRMVLERYRPNRMMSDIAWVENDIGFAYDTADRPEEAIPKYRSALHDLPLADRAGKATILYNLADAQRGADHLKDALANYVASELSAKGVDSVRVANCESAIGMTLRLSGRAKEAIPHLERALSLGDPQHKFGFTVVTLTELKAAYGQLSEKKKAKEVSGQLDRFLYEAFNTNTLMLGALGEGVLGTSTVGSFYALLRISASLDSLDPRFEFGQAESSKARGLVEIRRTTPIDLTKLNPLERQRWHDRVTRFQSAFSQQIKSLTGAVASDELALTLASQDLENYERRLRSRVATRSNLRPLSVIEAEASAGDPLAALKSLPANTLLVDTISVNEIRGSETILFLVWSEAGKVKVSARILKENGNKISTERLNRLCGSFWKACSDPTGTSARRSVVLDDESGSADVTAGPTLSKMLLDPITHLGHPFSRLLVCPDGPMWKVPFQCLPLGPTMFAADRWEIDYCYSAEQYLQCIKPRQNSIDNSVLVVANPDFGDESRLNESDKLNVVRGNWLASLPGTEQEAHRIESLFPSATVLSGGKAQEATVKQLLPNFSILHFATHGMVQEDAPMASCLVLSKPDGGTEDGFLTGSEISSMKLKAHLAVLSACDTGRGQAEGGEGLIGLSYAFLTAGCSSVVASLWPVNDKVGAQFMGEFYRELKQGKAKGQALRGAMLEIKSHNPAPYYWAPYVLLGDFGH